MDIEDSDETKERASMLAVRLVENAIHGKSTNLEVTSDEIYVRDVIQHLERFALCYYIGKDNGNYLPAMRIGKDIIPIDFLQGGLIPEFLSWNYPKATPRNFARMLRHSPFHHIWWEEVIQESGERIDPAEAKSSVQRNLGHFLERRIGVINWIKKFGDEALPPQAGKAGGGNEVRGSEGGPGGPPKARRGSGSGSGTGGSSRTTYFTVTVQTQNPGMSISSMPCYMRTWSGFGGPTRPITGHGQFEADGQLLPGRYYFGGCGPLIPSFTQDNTAFNLPPSFRCYLTAI